MPENRRHPYGPESGPRYRLGSETETSARAILGGATAESLVGAAAAVLAIIGLFGVLSFWMAALAAIAAAAAFLVEGATVAARYRQLLYEHGEPRRALEKFGGSGVHALGGVAALALAVLAMAGVVPQVLLSVAAVVLGAAAILGASDLPESEAAFGDPTRGEHRRWAAHQVVKATAGARTLAGLASLILGVIALATPGSGVTLSLVAFLVLGSVQLIGALALATRMETVLH